MSTIADKLNTLLATKSDIKDAIIEKGQNVADDTPFADYADKIRSIESGITNILGDAILTIGTNSALAGVSLLARPTSLGAYLYFYDRETNAYLSNDYHTLESDSTLQLKTAIGTSFSIGVYFGTVSSANIKQTSPVQDLVSTTAPIAPGTSERQCYIITGPNPIIKIIE